MNLSRFNRLWIASHLLVFVGLSACEKPPSAQQVTLETAYGDVVIDLYTDKAPLSAGDFIRYIDGGLYKDAGFYRVVRPDNDNGSPVISVIQGGLLYDSAGLDPVTHEPTSVTGLRHLDGTVSLARDEVGTGSAAAFFICIGDQPSLDEGGMRNPDGAGFAAFGRVVSGMDAVREILNLTGSAATDDPYLKDQMLPDPVLFHAGLAS